MVKAKMLRKFIAFAVTLTMALSVGTGSSPVSAASTETPSQVFVEAMGKGYNLGNTFESFNSDDPTQSDETAWGNPRVTDAFLKAIKAKGFSSIRMPFAATTRYVYSGGHFVLDTDYLARYKQVVDWAVADGFYVQIDLHDVWNWLNNRWDGNKTSAEYKMFVDFWTQLADTFKNEPNQVCFETANEPNFEDTQTDSGIITAQAKLDMINQAAYDSIRTSGGNNATRMIVIPTLNTNHNNSNPTYQFITGLNDPNIMATVHYYSEWVYSANLGRTGFDEDLYGDGRMTPRQSANQFYDTIYRTFTANGIGVIVGEYGMLSDDSSGSYTQIGEKEKYFELMNYLATKDKIALIFWDPGIFINRRDTINYSWKQPDVGAVVEAGMRGQRSSYASGLNEIYLSSAVLNNIQIPLSLNGNNFNCIAGLTNGRDYTYDAANATVTLTKEFVNGKIRTLGANEYGQIADLVLKFSQGADWHQYLIKYAAPVLHAAAGTTSGLTIPVDFNGAKLRRASAYDASGNRVGPNSSWWGYLQYGNGNAFTADYTENTISILPGFFNDGSVKDGTIKFTFEFYDGQKINYIMQKSGPNVTGKSA